MAADPKYQEFINANVLGHVAGLCSFHSRMMVNEFPELRLARGYYICPMGGRFTHWWNVDPDGNVIDATAGQFLSNGSGEYQELTEEECRLSQPHGKCAECGEYTYHDSFSKSFCTKECVDSFNKAIGTSYDG